MLACEKDADEFFTFLNSRHPNIKFTFEKEKDNKIVFLDMCINKTNHRFCSSVFRKGMSIGLCTNFSSFFPFFYKIGLIKTLVHQTFAISISWIFFRGETKNTENLLEKNMYLSYVIDKQIKLFLNNKLFENDTPEENTNKENRTYKKLPCIGNISVKIEKKTDELYKRFCKITDNNTVLTPFRLPNALRSFVVYKFLCARFQSCYIGETRRQGVFVN